MHDDRFLKSRSRSPQSGASASSVTAICPHPHGAVMQHEAILLALIFMAAMLYSCVGHAGASGYIAAMSLMGLAVETFRPAALILNIFVASVTSYRFIRAGHFDWRFFWPLALASSPFAYWGGSLQIPSRVLYITLGVVLAASAIRLVVELKETEEETKKPPNWVLLLIGGALGFLAGVSATGGGIFLTPVLILTHWRKAKGAAAISSAFIFVNSVAGLAGQLQQGITIDPRIGYWLVAALAGGAIGSELGARRLTPWWLKKVMAAVLLVAAIKLITTVPKTKPKDATSPKPTAASAASPKRGALVY